MNVYFEIRKNNDPFLLLYEQFIPVAVTQPCRDVTLIISYHYTID